MNSVNEGRRRILVGLGSAAATLALYPVVNGVVYAYSTSQDAQGGFLSALGNWFRRLFGLGVPATAASVVLTAGFGWEVVNLHNNGADMYVGVTEDIVLHWFDMDVSYMLTSTPSQEGFVEVLYTVGITSETPQFSPSPQVYQSLPRAQGFTPVTIVNPNNLQTVADAYPEQGFLTRLILKSWVPRNGTASQVQRHITLYPNLVLRRGSYIVFHMDQAGVVPVDSEIQVSIGYSVLGG